MRRVKIEDQVVLMTVRSKINYVSTPEVFVNLERIKVVNTLYSFFLTHGLLSVKYISISIFLEVLGIKLLLFWKPQQMKVQAKFYFVFKNH
jgi:hypothetical protein